MPDNQADSDSGMMSDRQADSADRPVPCESSERDGIKPERGPQTADTGHRKDRVLNSFSAFHSPSPGPSAISESPLPGADPTDFDILCGKSRDCVGHIGSIRYREYIDTYRERYALCKTKHAKMQIIKEIYHNLSQRCRFLKFNKQIGVWEEITAQAAKDKVGHALRFANSKGGEQSGNAPSATRLQRETGTSDQKMTSIQGEFSNRQMTITPGPYHADRLASSDDGRNRTNIAGHESSAMKRHSWPELLSMSGEDQLPRFETSGFNDILPDPDQLRHPSSSPALNYVNLGSTANPTNQLRHPSSSFALNFVNLANTANPTSACSRPQSEIPIASNETALGRNAPTGARVSHPSVLMNPPSQEGNHVESQNLATMALESMEKDTLSDDTDDSSDDSVRIMDVHQDAILQHAQPSVTVASSTLQENPSARLGFPATSPLNPKTPALPLEEQSPGRTDESIPDLDPMLVKDCLSMLDERFSTWSMRNRSALKPPPPPVNSSARQAALEPTWLSQKATSPVCDGINQPHESIHSSPRQSNEEAQISKEELLDPKTGILRGTRAADAAHQQEQIVAQLPKGGPSSLQQQQSQNVQIQKLMNEPLVEFGMNASDGSGYSPSPQQATAFLGSTPGSSFSSPIQPKPSDEQASSPSSHEEILEKTSSPLSSQQHSSSTANQESQNCLKSPHHTRLE